MPKVLWLTYSIKKKAFSTEAEESSLSPRWKKKAVEIIISRYHHNLSHIFESVQQTLHYSSVGIWVAQNSKTMLLTYILRGTFRILCHLWVRDHEEPRSFNFTHKQVCHSSRCTPNYCYKWILAPTLLLPAVSTFVEMFIVFMSGSFPPIERGLSGVTL